MQCVVGLNNTFAPVIQAPVAQKKTGSAQRKVLLVIARDSVRNKNQPRAVKFSAPSPAVATNSDWRRLVHSRVGKRLVLAIVPSPSSEYSPPIIERLFEIGSK